MSNTFHPRIAAWLKEPAAPNPIRVAGRHELLPVMSPKYNFREICKQLVLLEDHLFNPKKRCLDCIRKHLLTAEALAEETVTLDLEGLCRPTALALADCLREAWDQIQHVHDPGAPDFQEIAQSIRRLRKPLMLVSSYVRVASHGSTLHEPGACPSQVMFRRIAGYFNLGDAVFFGKYKNKKGIIVKFYKDDRGVPMIEVEPVPKGRKKNRAMGLFKIWHMDMERRAGRLFQLPAPTRVVKPKHTVSIGGKKYALSDDPGDFMTEMLGDPDEGHADGHGPTVIQGPQHSRPYRFLWAFDSERGDVAMWRVTDGNEKVYGGADNFRTKLVTLDRDGELNRVTTSEMRAIEREMRKLEKQMMKDMQTWLDDHKSEYQGIVDDVAREVLEKEIRPSLERRLAEAKKGVIPFGFKVNDRILDYESEAQQIRGHIISDESTRFTPELVEAELLHRGIDPDAAGHDIQAAYWAVTDLIQDLWHRYKKVAKHKDQIPGGVGDKAQPSDVDPEQLAKGIKVEMEHTDDEEVAEEIEKHGHDLWSINDPTFNEVMRKIYAAYGLPTGPERVAARHLIDSAAKYQNKKKVKTQKGDEVTIYEYSDGQVAHRNREKAKRIEKLRGSITKLRSQMKKDLGASDPDTRLTALAVALIDHTYERVGNDQSAKDGHYGVTGWTVGHITFSGSTATLKYVGKSGVDQTKKVTDTKLVKALKAATKGKGKDEVILCEGDDCVITANEVNSYLKEFDVTAKDLRGLHANEEMKTELKKVRKGKLPEDKKEREKQLKDEFAKALEAAASAVGHEPATLKSQYLVPGLEDAFMKDGTVPAKLDKTSTDREPPYAPVGVYCKTSIIHLWNATDGEESELDLRGLPGLISSLTLFEQAVVLDMNIHSVPILGVKGAYTLRGHKVQDDVVGELVASGYLEEQPDGIFLSPLFGAKQKLYRTASSHLPEPSEHIVTADGDLLTMQEFAVAAARRIREAAHRDYDTCPMCGEMFTSQCRCQRSDRRCPNGHQWSTCLEHGVIVSLGEGVNTHAEPGCICHLGSVVGVRNKAATKTRLEKEDEAVNDLIRRQPKKKPPRKDLHNNQLEDFDADDDPDTKQDRKDQSQNWKDGSVQAEWAGLTQRLAASKRQRKKLKKQQEAQQEAQGGRKPGEIWQPEGADTWSAKSKDGEESKSGFKTQDAAQGWVNGDETAGEEDAPAADTDKKEDKEEDKKEDKKEEEDKKKEEEEGAIAEVTRLTKHILNPDSRGDSELPEGFQSRMTKKLDSLGPKDREKFLASMADEIAKFPDDPPMGMAAVNAGREALGADFRKMTPASSGKALAQALYAERVTFNPLMLGGIKVSEETETSTAAESAAAADGQIQRSLDAKEYYGEMDEDERAKGVERCDEALRDLVADSPRAQEIQAIKNGIAMSAILKGEEPDGVQVSAQFTQLAQAMALVGEENRLLGSLTDLTDPESQEAVRSALTTMTDRELVGFIGGEDGSHPMAPLAEALTARDDNGDYKLSEDERAEIRKWIEGSVIEDIAFLDPLVGDYLEANGKPNKQADRAKYIEEHTEKVNENAASEISSFLGHSELDTAEGIDNESRASTDALAAQLAASGAERRDSVIDALEQDFDTAPETDAVAVAKAVKNEGSGRAIGQRKTKPGEAKPESRPKGSVWGDGNEWMAKTPKGEIVGPFSKGRAEQWASGGDSGPPPKTKKASASLPGYDFTPWPKLGSQM